MVDAEGTVIPDSDSPGEGSGDTVPPLPRRRGRPPGSKNRPKFDANGAPIPVEARAPRAKVSPGIILPPQAIYIAASGILEGIAWPGRKFAGLDIQYAEAQRQLCATSLDAYLKSVDIAMTPGQTVIYAFAACAVVSYGAALLKGKPDGNPDTRREETRSDDSASGVRPGPIDSSNGTTGIREDDSNPRVPDAPRA